MSPSLSIIGAGKVGSTLARLLYQADYTMAAILSRTFGNAQALAEIVHAHAVHTGQEAIEEADLIILAVPDDVLDIVVESLAELDWTNKAVVHTSGANSIEPLQVLARQGAMVGSFHPSFPFADVESAIAGLAGAGFAIEAEDEELRNWLLGMVAALRGKPILIPAGQKAVYHAALVIASNYTVTLYAIGQMLLRSIGASEDAISSALDVLLEATTHNILAHGLPNALTGPLARVDIGTIEAHLKGLQDENLRRLYIELARFTYPVLEQRGIPTDLIEESLRGIYETPHD
jgi:predicted short-subunit dehydrogenase-like oxidoreductase (DUF2520 family)